MGTNSDSDSSDSDTFSEPRPRSSFDRSVSKPFEQEELSDSSRDSHCEGIFIFLFLLHV